MKTISLAIPEQDYEAFRAAAKLRHQPVTHLIREAMAVYRVPEIEIKPPLRTLRLFPEVKVKSKLPSRAEIYDEMFS